MPPEPRETTDVTTSNTPTSFLAGQLYSSEEIQNSLEVGNAGGVRISLDATGGPRRIVVMTAHLTARQASENPYHDRIEGNTLVYTGAGREGDQTLGGVNQRIPQQLARPFPIYGFTLTGSRRDKAIGPKRWQFLGLLQYLRHYPELQVDTRLQKRRVWIFELRVLDEPEEVVIATEMLISSAAISAARLREPDEPCDREIAPAALRLSDVAEPDVAVIESVRGQLLGVTPVRFEHIVRDALLASGFQKVTVTQYSQDGGVDVNASAGALMWPIHGLFVQIQAKRWLHTVGRREVAELRGSLQPFARGAVVTTSHYSRAAIAEASEAGKNPIILVDGFAFASLIHSLKISI